MVLKNKVLGVLNDKEGLDKELLAEYENYQVANFVYNSAIMEKKIRVSFDEVLNYNKFKTSALKHTNSYDAVQISNLFNAHFYLQELLAKKEKMSEDIIKNIHQIIMNDVQPGGVYRHFNITVNGSKFIPTGHEKIYDRMAKVFEHIETLENDLEKARIMLKDFENIVVKLEALLLLKDIKN